MGTVRAFLADKPLVAAFLAFVAAVVTSVCHAAGVGAISAELVTAIDATAGAVVSTWIGGEAHKAAQTGPPSTAPAGATATSSTPTGTQANVADMLAAGFAAAAQELQSKAG